MSINSPLEKENLTDFDYFTGRKPGKTYVSSRFFHQKPDGLNRPMRYIYKVIDTEKGVEEAIVKDEKILKFTRGWRQQLKAKIFEDNKKMISLVLQRFSTISGIPKETSFCFSIFELETLKNFIDSIPYLDFSTDGKSRVEDDEIRKIREFLSKNPDLDLVIEFAQHKITKADIVALGYRKKQLEIFSNLLNDDNFFNQQREEIKLLRKIKEVKDEYVWQLFFEKNPWIFGYGLNFVFNSPLEGKKLEQVVSGSDFNSSGKRTDGLLKTAGLISSICLVEIKTPKTNLIKGNRISYREECWQISDELNGGVAQSHKTVQKTLSNIRGAKVEIKGKEGNLTGEVVYSYQPKSYLIVGSLSEFITEKGVNEDKLGSFELFRRNMINPEIITFDELYERAKFIVHNAEESTLKK